MAITKTPKPEEYTPNKWEGFGLAGFVDISAFI